VLSLDVKVTPRASRDEIVRVARGRVTIASGHRSRSKRVQIDAGSEALERLTE
jgi:uncharacterized protein YggU (UPF0235/DUF167 family)